jgi:flagellin-like protein
LRPVFERKPRTIGNIYIVVFGIGSDMQLRKLAQEDDAVSPVIGVILMVAITVILAAVIASFVLGLGQNQAVQPNSSFEFDFNESGDDRNSLSITLSSGDSVNPEEMYLRGSINDVGIDGNWSSDGGIMDPDGASDTPFKSGHNVQATYSDTTQNATGIGGFDGSEEMSSGQGFIMWGTSESNDINSYDLDIIWEVGSDSATLASDSS